MKVLEVTTKERIVDPHKARSAGKFNGGRKEFTAAEGYEMTLHESGLAVWIKGQQQHVLATIEVAYLAPEDEEHLPDVPGKVVKSKGKPK